MARVDRDPRESKAYVGSDQRSWRQRRAGDGSRERRLGASRLSTWSGRRMFLTSLGWIISLVALVCLAAAANILAEHSTEDVRLALTRSNLIAFAASLVLPPVCLTAQWWRMRGRRRTPREARRDSSVAE